MENSVLESLRELGFVWSPQSSGHLTNLSNPFRYDSPGVVLTAGIKDENFRQLVRKLTTEIHHLAETEEQPGNSNDTDMLAIELSSFLNELNCPYQFVTNGSVADRFHSAQGSLKLLDYLTAELMSLKMYHCNRVASKGTVIELQETLVASALKGICNAFGIAQPPPASLTTSDLFQKLNMRLDEVLKKYGRDRIGQPLLDIDVSKSWTGKQWADLEKRHGELDKEYDLRREMLLTRLDCTVQAFNWSERMAKKHGQILEAYKAKLQVLEKLVKGGANTDIVALLAARDLLLAIEKASSAAVLKNTKSKIQRHIMGNVPDRGK